VQHCNQGSGPNWNRKPKIVPESIFCNRINKTFWFGIFFGSLFGSYNQYIVLCCWIMRGIWKRSSRPFSWRVHQRTNVHFWIFIIYIIYIIYYILGVQISSVHFSKDNSSCCEWFIVTAFGGFREVKYLLIIFSLYRFEFHTKTLIFIVFEMSNFVLIKQHLREVLIFCFNWMKSAKAHWMLVEVYGDNW